MGYKYSCGVVVRCVVGVDLYVVYFYVLCCEGGGGGGELTFFEFRRVACREVREIRGMFHEKYFLNCAIWGDLQYILIKF